MDETQKRKKFVKFLDTQGLSFRTIKEYLYLFKKFEREVRNPHDQEKVDEWLRERNNAMTRAFLKKYRDFENLDIKVRKKRGTKPKKVTTHIPRRERDIVIAYLYKHVGYEFGLAVELVVEMALRREEVVILKKKDFNLEKWLDDLNENNNAPCEVKIRGKGNKERILLCPYNTMKRVMKHLVDLNPEEKLFDWKSPKNKLWRKYKKAVEESIEKDYTLHELRHSKATDWYNDGVDIVKIKNRLGHADISTTQLYINPDEKKTRDEWRKELIESNNA